MTCPPENLSTSAADHERLADAHAEGAPARCCVLTVSDTRTPETDTGGRLIRERLTAAGYSISHHAIVKDEPDQIRSQLIAWLAHSNVDAILTTGGTGVSRRDTTIEVVDDLITKPLDGFGELFRFLSWKEVGAAAMLSRAVGGLIVRDDQPGDVFIFAMPGSTNAVATAIDNLIVPQLNHLIWERSR